MTSPRDKRQTASKVNATPIGLQSLLGNVNQGVNPHELNHEIQPIVDLLPFWSSRRLIKESDTQSLSIVHGQGINLTVPEGELWLPIAAHFECGNFATATDDISLTVGIVPPLNVGMVSFNSTDVLNNPGSAGSTARACIAFPQAFILSGGWSVRGEINGASNTTARNCTLETLYVKMGD